VSHPLTVVEVAYAFAEVSTDAVGGAEQVVAMLDRALTRAGHRSLVIAPDGSRVGGELLANGPIPELIDGAARLAGAQCQSALIARLLRQRPVDLIHLHSVDLPYLLEACGPVPVVATLHLPVDFYAPSVFTQPGLHLQFVSESQRTSAAPAARRHPVIENGVDLAAFQPQPRRQPFAVALGRICPEKAFDRAARAARRAGVPLLLAGRVYPYQEHRRHFDRDIAPLLGPGVRFLGPIGLARKRSLLARARCLVVPSAVAETSSLVAMEALASGTPVVAWRSGALPDLIDHGRTGFLVDSEDQLADAIAAAAALDGQTCRRAAERRFCSRRMTAEYLQIYQRTSGRAREPTMTPAGGSAIVGERGDRDLDQSHVAPAELEGLELEVS
jgi:glycosyltransferase involved in cell wall biosynthesis